MEIVRCANRFTMKKIDKLELEWAYSLQKYTSKTKKYRNKITSKLEKRKKKQSPYCLIKPNNKSKPLKLSNVIMKHP